MSVRVLSWVFESSTVTHRGDLLVLLVLADHAHDDGTHAFPSVEKIARKSRLSRRGTQLALRRLERLGAIEATGSEGPHRPRSYRVVMGEPTSPRTGCRGEVSGTEGRSETHVGAQRSSPEPSVEPSVEPSSLSSIESKRREGEVEAIHFNVNDLAKAKQMPTAVTP
jgi:Helix-turn-helix domain